MIGCATAAFNVEEWRARGLWPLCRAAVKSGCCGRAVEVRRNGIIPFFTILEIKNRKAKTAVY